MKIWLVVLAVGLSFAVSGCAGDVYRTDPCQWRYGYHYLYPGPISNEAPPLPKAPGGSDDEPRSSGSTAEVPVLQKAPPEEETLRNMRNVEICEYRRRYTCGGDCFCAADGNLDTRPTYRYYR